MPCIYAGKDSHLRGDGASAGGMRNKDGSHNVWSHAGQVTQETKIPDSVIRIMRHKGGIGEGIDHPAVFPVALPKFVMNAYTDKGEMVYEPFSGSGTTILAGEACGRKVRASELAPEYVDVAVIRWMKHHPDQMPVLEATGQTWEEVKAQREPEGMTAEGYQDRKKRMSDVFNDRMKRLEAQGLPTPRPSWKGGH